MESQAQVVVIGSGAGGASFAWSMATAGARVLLLEAGPAYDPSEDYRLDQATWERGMFPAKVETRGRQTHAPLQKLDRERDGLRSWNHLQPDRPKKERRQFSAYHHVVGVGGSTLHFTGEAHRLHPQAMKMRSRFGVGADWPIAYADLEPFYGLAEKIIGVAGPADPGVRERSEPYPMPAHEPSYASRILGRGFRQAGLSWTPNPVASLSRAYDGRPACNYCGQCTRGCPRYDKGTADITFIAKARPTGNLDLRPVSQVLRLETGESGRVEAAIYADRKGVQHRVRGALFVVACGAVETPRLLLNSADPASPEGLCNDEGQVGLHFMETLSFVSVGLHSEPLGSFRGLPSDSICWDFNAPDAIDGVIGGCRLSPMTLEMNLAGPISYARRVVGGWGREHKRAMRETFGRAVALGGIGESLPNAGTFVDLDPGEKDAHGLPKARIHSRLDDMAIERLSFIAEKAREILNACGAGEIIEEGSTYDHFNSTHVFGTCRMGNAASDSVVDRDCRSHRWRNLMIVDASVFPSTGGGEAPALTICANALRAARAAQS